MDESGIVHPFKNQRTLVRVDRSKHIPSSLELQELFSVKKAPKKRPGRKLTREPLPSTALGFKIRAAREKMGLSLEVLSQRIGISNQALSLIETGGSNPSESRLMLLAGELKTDFGLSRLRKYIKDNDIWIKIEARVAAGEPLEEMDGEAVTLGSQFSGLSGEICALRVKGDSMKKDEHILNGDILICRRNPERPRKDALAVIRLRGEFGAAAIKRWRWKDDTVVLSSNHYDQDSEKYEYPIWKVAETFEVLGVIRRYNSRS